ncbi:MAG: thiamine pyrophosphate-binding protein [Gammaproteobacteria bacterium]|nr:thiamine pyrophosphate-binding protein [Gammaproteobacteria bacterium]
MNGADLIVDALVARGIKRLYLFPGGTIAPVLHSAKQRSIDLFCARHEQGAAYAALAAARLSGQPQVVVVTSGPGVTNVITSIADAYYDSTPLLLLTGQVGTTDLCRDLPLRQRGFQEVDTVALLRSVTKAQFLVEETSTLRQTVAQAYTLAGSGRPGPVVVDLPMDVQRAQVILNTDAGVSNQHVSCYSNHYGNRFPSTTLMQPDSTQLKQLVSWLMTAQRPVIIAGQGVLLSLAHTELRRIVRQHEIPVSHSLLGLGAMPTESGLSLGFHGHTGNQVAGKAIQQADLVIAVGSRLDVRQTGNCYDDFVPDGKIVRLDLDAAEIEGSRIRTDLFINADAKASLTILHSQLQNQCLPDWSDWREQINQWRRDYKLSYEQRYAKKSAIKPQYVVECLSTISHGRNVVCVTGVGSHQHWVARHFDFDFPKRRLLTSGGHGAMGYDLPSAIGAQIYDPSALVLCIVGDGSLQLNIQELASVVEYQLPIKIIVIDNHRLGIVSQFQQLNWQDDPTTGCKWNPDFASIAKAYGLAVLSITQSSEVKSGLRQALAHNGPVLVHCIVDETEDIVPMLLSGQTLDCMWPYDK